MIYRRTSTILLLCGCLLCGCASVKKSGISWYQFDDKGSRSNAPVVSQRDVSTRVYFESLPPGASVYAYDNLTGDRGRSLGKTPCQAEVMTFQIIEYSNMTAEYSVDYLLPFQFTRPVDFSDIKNDYGEVTFSFILEKRGYPAQVYHLPIKATAETLVMALAERRVPSYTVTVNFE